MKLLAKTLFGLEDVLAKEILAIGGKDIIILKRGVSYQGDKELLYKSNVSLRTALRILLPVYSFTFSNQKDYYNRIKSFDWEKYLSPQETFAIDGTVSSEIISHSKYAALLAKDAIADRFREKYNRRPSVDVNSPDIRINIHIYNNECNVSLDSSGTPLFKRGYRIGMHEAHLNEVLAAGMILLSNWDRKSTFIDPMCGSGTLPIEAALIAYNIPPGIFRKEFGFMKWKNFDEKLFANTIKYKPKDIDVKIIGSDLNPSYVRMAKNNSKNAGLISKIKFVTKSFESQISTEDGGVIVMNPPYGQRIVNDDINALYSMIGERLKHEWTGFEAWMLTSNFDAIKHVGLRPSKKIKLFNGSLECRFVNYSLYKGSRKGKKEADL